ncbi:hypothetical protein MVEN_01163000 [Mycena venus]|uniref:Uncharacterized protein n=1 Tax=Mycena venus TaxID=2733690 RepID=A0A8H6Y0W9_9AGAR|nr:hypothetical protein MVEN_01163000 [Mycena venus]
MGSVSVFSFSVPDLSPTRNLGPPDDVLREALHRYASLRLKSAQRLANLAHEFNYHIKYVRPLLILIPNNAKSRSTKLKELNTEFNVGTVRKPPPISVATTLVCDKLDEDINQADGPDTIKTLLALDGHQIPRDTIRQIVKDNAPESSLFGLQNGLAPAPTGLFGLGLGFECRSKPKPG